MGRQLSSKMFPATWGQDCTECGEWIEEEDLAGYLDNQLVCDACWNEADLENERELMVLSGQTPGLLPGHTALEPSLQAVVDKAAAMEAPAPIIDVQALIAAGKAKLAAQQAAERAALAAQHQQEQAALPAEPAIDVAALIAAGRAKLEAQAAELEAQERAEAAGWTGPLPGPEIDPGEGDPWTSAAAEGWPPPEGPDLLGKISRQIMAEDEAALQADLLTKAMEVAPPMERLEAALDQLAPYRGDHDPDGLITDALEVIQDAIVNAPRSLQVTIGPSEIGTECDHCLVAKLANWPQKQTGQWLPTVGTAVHAWIENVFSTLMAQVPALERRWLTEAKVYCGDIGGDRVVGSTDLLDLWHGATLDWKVVGATTLKTVKAHGPSTVYRTQQQIYAHGWNMAGVKVKHCGIMYLPRNALSLFDGEHYTEPYDPDVALAALERASKWADWLAGMSHLPAEQRDAFISLLPRKRDAKGVIDCFDCKRYPDFPDSEKTQLDHSMGGLVDLSD